MVNDFILQFMHWFAMNGYGKYIWSAYGLALLLLVICAMEIKIKKIKTQKFLRRWLQDK